jgi:ABC-type bacteriocin/lantibiotic exporter with double-glycine peptidase domain
MRGIGRRLRPVLSEVLAVVAMGVLATIPSLAVAAVAKFFVDDVLVQGLTERAWPLVAALAGLVLLQVLITSMQMRILIRLGNRLTVVESARFVLHALRLPERYFVARSVTDLALRAQHNREMSVLLTGRVASAGVGLVMMIVYAVALVVIDPVLGLIAIASTVLTLVALRSGLNRQRHLSQVLVAEQAVLNATTAYGAVTMETIKAGGLEGDYHGRWEGTAVRVNEARQRMAVAAQVGDSVPFMLRSLLAAGVLCIGGLLVMDGSLGVGSLVAFQSLLSSFSAPVAELVGFSWLVQHLQNIVRRLDDVMDEPVDPACDPEIQTMEFVGGSPRLDGALELRGVTFGFKPTVPPLTATSPCRSRRGRASRWSGRRAAASRRSSAWSPGSTSRGKARSCSTGADGTRSRARCWRARSRWWSSGSPCSRAPCATT